MTLPFEIMSWIGAAALLGMYCFTSTGKARHVIFGQVSGLIGNLLYIGVGLHSGVYAMAVMGVIFAALNGRGIIEWGLRS